MMGNVLNVLRNAANKPGYTFMRGMARFAVARKTVTALRATVRPGIFNRMLKDCDARIEESCFVDLDREGFLRSLSEEGVAEGLVLPREIVNKVVDWSRQQPCYADRDPRHGFMLDQRALAEQRLGKPILVAQYFNTHRTCRQVRQLASDPVLQGIAARYLRSEPAFVGANLWWTFPVQALETDRDRHAHLFHRDVDDFRFVKFFFYLTDVLPGEGAHICVKGSHEQPPALRVSDRWTLRRYSDTEISTVYPVDRVLELCGPAGTGFAEDTLCIHKGSTPRTAARLLLQLQFALFDYGVVHDDRAQDALSRVV